MREEEYRQSCSWRGLLLRVKTFTANDPFILTFYNLKKGGIQRRKQGILKLTIPESMCIPRKMCTNCFNGKIDRHGREESVKAGVKKRESSNGMLA